MDDTQTQINKLAEALQKLNTEFYSNNFSAHQDFNKTSNFTTRLKIPHYTSLPTICEQGEIVESSGILYICSSPNVFTKVGSQ